MWVIRVTADPCGNLVQTQRRSKLINLEMNLSGLIIRYMYFFLN